MKRFLKKVLCILMSLLVLCGCSQNTDNQEPSEKDNSEDGKVDQLNSIDIPQTGYTETVPQEYKNKAEHQGTVERLDYESKDYVRDSSVITKTAYVYLPYGYDENDEKTRYDIVYLMHGWGGRAGEYFDYTPTRNMFDNLIENGGYTTGDHCISYVLQC